MTWHDLDFIALILLVACLFARGKLYQRMFPYTSSATLKDSIRFRTDIVIAVFLLNLLVLGIEALGFQSLREFWVILVVTGGASLILIPFFVSQEVALIKGKGWTKRP